MSRSPASPVAASAAPTIVWRRLDEPGHDWCRLDRDGAGWALSGTAVLAHESTPCRLEYHVHCDERWRTRAARVSGWIGERRVAAEISADEQRRWVFGGAEVPEVAGALDVDLAFTPATNLLPIRRLELDIGGEAEVRAAWLTFPELQLQPLDQLYRRTAEDAYRYESAGGSFTRDLAVTPQGFVTRYPGLWEVEASLL